MKAAAPLPCDRCRKSVAEDPTVMRVEVGPLLRVDRPTVRLCSACGVALFKWLAMMKKTTHRTTWKARERQAAAAFGSRRQVCSGSSGRDDRTRSDSTHERLFVETKLRAKSATVSLFDATRTLARKENKVPVLMLATKGRPGLLLVLDVPDLPTVAAEYRALVPEPLEALGDASRS